MKNITFSADEKLIREARKQAISQNTTLNQAFREWLKQYVAKKHQVERFTQLLKQTSYVRVGRKFTREEMNER